MTIGYLTFAIGETYLRHAYALALSIKVTQKNSKFAVIIDSSCKIEPKHEQVFDHIIVLNTAAKNNWDMSNEWQALDLTPFKETIKLDADMLFTSSVDHWWSILRNRNVVFTTSVHDFRWNIISSRKHRKLFDENFLPNIYSGCFYFRKSETAYNLFANAKEISDDWEWFATEHLRNNRDSRIRTDEVFALAVRMIGLEECSLPYTVPSFVHMKGFLNGLADPWYEQVYSLVHNGVVNIGNFRQRLPFHYHHKEWLTDTMIENYERYYRELI